MAEVVLVDAGGSNIGSLCYALERLGAPVRMSDDPESIRAASHVILPGVGAAGPGMARLRAKGLDGVLRSLTQPVLGVCLGMQLLFERSEEGDVKCLGQLPGTVRQLHGGNGVRIPHMGWNRLQLEGANPLLKGLDESPSFVYFVHSYAAPVTVNTLAYCEHGVPLSAVVRKGNFYGMQFHPERSAALGARLLGNFLSL
ncbi:MAG TPA: imidazole glycerol phosphate synthase subunit HisH [Mizugakiibacter sp.]|nr:imidazole glycerol phosphate synthase subunit HisH [Mizugakiibacter sp.]